MAFKFVVFVACLALANASVAPLHGLYYSAPVVTKTIVDTEYDPNPQYTYSYGVQDALTGDSKSQTETRSGDFVKGQYSLLDSDGTKRVVDYAADSVNGFSAVVSKTPAAVPVVAKVATPVVAAPAIAKIATPFVAPAPLLAAPTFAKIAAPSYTSYAAPAYTSYAAPVVAKAAVAAPAISSYSTTVAATGPVVAAYAAPAHGIPSVAAYAAPAVASYAAAPVTKTVITGPSAVSYSSPAVSYVSEHGEVAPLVKYW